MLGCFLSLAISRKNVKTHKQEPESKPKTKSSWTRSTLEWIINQYCVKMDKRSGMVNDLNRADNLQYIVTLIGKVITVSLETVDITDRLPVL